MVAWIRDELPANLVESIPESGWKRLVITRRWSVLPELDGRDEVMVAGEFGEKAACLVQEIRARA
jgi:hypothetical protein